MKPFVADPDFTLYVGDVREVLAQLPAESVDCVVTSPPYWGLRDYDVEPTEWPEVVYSPLPGFDFEVVVPPATCQLGLEADPAAFVGHLVLVFRELHRVLASHGTCWLNLGDTYASKARGSDEGWATSRLTNPASQQKVQAAALRRDGQRHRGKLAGLKEKDLAGVPWRVALALQADGWWLRSDVVWSKPNVMPESTTDRPTKAHEYVFLLAKSARYFYDQDAVREPHKEKLDVASWDDRRARGASRGNVRHGAGTQRVVHGANGSHDLGHALGRNLRSVWEIATQPYKGAHFAVFPPRLAERGVLAGTPLEVCTVCGKPRVRIVEKGEPVLQEDTWSATGAAVFDAETGVYELADASSTLKHVVPRVTVGWTDCGHGSYRTGVVLDPFMGSGTTAREARAARRHVVGVELNPRYAALCAERLQQLTLLEGTAAAVGQTAGSGAAAINGEPERVAAPSSIDAEEAA